VINRRAFLCGLTLATLAGPLATEAQQAGKVYRIGFLITGSSTDQRHLVGAFGHGLRELGWVEGQNIVIDYRFADGRFDRLPELAAELVRLKVDIIVAGPTPAAAAAKNATATIPIVMAVGGARLRRVLGVRQREGQAASRLRVGDEPTCSSSRSKRPV